MPTEAQIKEAMAALQQCEDYFEDRADAWTENDRWVGNEEMQLLGIVGRALDALGNRKLPRKCSDCLTNYADPPSTLCPGCQAYRDHTGAI